ncbi:MAG: PilZ domain-containing protein [Deltaproteobacteria bacterium]|nr:PilZ domain-containing protein [Deltaproteobacteria bacterium]
MFDSGDDRRRFKRIFFPEQSKVQAFFSYQGNGSHLMSATVLNLSETGIGLTVRKKTSNGILAGDKLVLKEISSLPQLFALRDIISEIRWVLNHDFLDHIGFGCEFLNAPAAVKTQIRRFITIEEILAEDSP